MSPKENGPGGVGAAEAEGTFLKHFETIAIIARSGSTCLACRRPTVRWSAICRPCLAAHYRLDGLVRAHQALEVA